MLDFSKLIPEPHYFIHRKSTPNWCIKPDVVPFNDLTYIVKGQARYTIGTETVNVKAGDLIYVPCNSFRAAVPLGDELLECHSFNFFLYNQKGVTIPLQLNIHNHIGEQPQLLKLCSTTNEIWSEKGFGYELQARGYLCIIISMVMNILYNPSYRNSNMDIRIQHAVKYVNAHYFEPITIRDVAEIYHLHPAYFGNLFQKTMGSTFKQYLTRIRLNHAENLLRSGEYSVNEVAFQCGFSDVFYFSKIFKKYKGVNPSTISKSYY